MKELDYLLVGITIFLLIILICRCGSNSFTPQGFELAPIAGPCPACGDGCVCTPGYCKCGAQCTCCTASRQEGFNGFCKNGCGAPPTCGNDASTCAPLTDCQPGGSAMYDGSMYTSTPSGYVNPFVTIPRPVSSYTPTGSSLDNTGGGLGDLDTILGPSNLSTMGMDKNAAVLNAEHMTAGQRKLIAQLGPSEGMTAGQRKLISQTGLSEGLAPCISCGDFNITPRSVEGMCGRCPRQGFTNREGACGRCKRQGFTNREGLDPGGCRDCGLSCGANTNTRGIRSGFRHDWTEYATNMSQVTLYYRDGCPPCDRLKPTWLRLEKEFPWIKRVDITKTNAPHIRATPTILKAVNGKNVEYNGDRSYESLKKFIST